MNRFTGHLWLFLFGVGAIFRLVFTGDCEILALNLPQDDYWYIHTAFDKIWGGTYSEMSFVNLPIYSAWLYLLHLLGMSVRLAIDVSWLLAIGYLSFAFYRLTDKVWIAFLIFVYLGFHPYTVVIFDRALPETFLTVISAVILGAGVEIWNCRDVESTFRYRFAIIAYVVGFALAFHTRKEGIVLVVPLLVFACYSWFDRRRWWGDFGKHRLAISLLLAPILSIFLLGAILAVGNYIKWGVLARYELAAPGYQRAVGALNRIDVGPTPRQCTVTKEVLSQAYKESPTFRTLQPFIEGPVCQGWVAVSSRNTGIPDEISNGWFYWALRDAAAYAGWHKDAILADSKYAAVADELEEAFSSGRLKGRKYTLSAFLDPDISKWMPEVPQSVFNVLQLLVRPRVQDLFSPREDDYSVSASQFNQYVVITRRRAEPSGSGMIVEVNGWIVMPAGTLVGLGTAETVFSWTPLSGTQRPDVPGAYALSVSAGGAAEVPTELHILSSDGRKGSVGLNTFKEQAVSISTGAIQAEIGVDSLKYSKVLRADKWLSKLCATYEFVGYAFCLAAMGALFLLMARRIPFSGLALVLGFVVVAIIVRVALFSLIDASSYYAIQARYMLPVIPAFACMGGLGLAFLSGLYGKKEQK